MSDAAFFTVPVNSYVQSACTPSLDAVTWDALFDAFIPGARLLASIHEWTSNVVTLEE